VGSLLKHDSQDSSYAFKEADKVYRSALITRNGGWFASDHRAPSLEPDHAAIRVPDFEMAVAWYADMLDFRLKQSVSVAGLSFGFLYPAGDESFHFELMAGPGAAERPAFKDLHDSCNMSGWHHPGFTVDSVDAAIDELTRREVTIAGEPHDVSAMGLPRNTHYFEGVSYKNPYSLWVLSLCRAAVHFGFAAARRATWLWA
jgi:catechol 2,3-dioxygenase-like lactoylglutathione lyase family enzyme